MKSILFKIIYRVLVFYARKVIKRHNPFVIAVTGSVGKTSTKEAIYTVLSDQFPGKVRKNYGNLNAEIGIPWTILGYENLPNNYLWPFFLITAGFKIFTKDYPEYLILEMGVEHKGDIQYFCSIVQPDIAVITSVSGAHLANFSGLEELQKEKISLINYLKPDGKIIVNHDDPVLFKLKDSNIVSVAVQKDADYKAETIKLSASGTEFRIISTGHKISIKSNLLGRQMIYSQLFAFTVADILNCSLIGTGKSLEKISTLAGRMKPVEGKNGTIIIDDTYNSNPTSAKSALDFLKEINYPHRKVVIMGNMNELGDIEKEAHKEIGLYARGKCDLAIFIGKNSEIMKRAFGEESEAMSFPDRKSFELEAGDIIKKDDLILIKASQNNNYFEEIVKKLMLETQKAKKILVRQGNGWQRKK